jgi:peroxiredoxin
MTASRLPARTALAFAGLVSLASACAGTGTSAEGGGPVASSRPAGVSEGAMATDFAARNTEGKTVKLTDYLGKQAVLIDFWATYCEPCLAEMPSLRALYEKHKAQGFVVLAVSVDGPETVADVPSFAKRNGMVFPVLLDEDSRITSIYNPKKSAPLSVLIDKNGKVQRVHEGFNPGDEALLEHAVENLLDPGAAGK